MNIEKMNYEQFGRKFLEEYLSRGMGCLSKREIDVLVMHLLHVYAGAAMDSNHDLCVQLRIPETRLKGLRYEAKLQHTSYAQKDAQTDLLCALINAQYDFENGKIVFSIEDKYLRQHLQAKLKACGYFADSSFNSEIVKVKPDYLRPILEDLYGKKSSDSFMQRMKKVKNEADFTAAMKALAGEVICCLGKAAVPEAMHLIQNFLL